jgi:DNA-binding CsgD family transcriptional regulator/tetratricopeptide (TPR) repeat protein
MATSNPGRSGSALIGRDHEIGACNELLGRASHAGGVLLLRGSPGVGKTSVLDAARDSALLRGFRVLSATGSEVERGLAFAGLQLLLLPVIDVDTGLPEHLLTALRSALGLLDAEIPELATVGLAVLGLLAGIANEEIPLCVIIDDVHWLDDSSAEVLRFVARRLSADPIVMLAAARDGGWPPAGMLPELRIDPLGHSAAVELLASRGQSVPPSVQRRIIEQAEGNPLALVELSGALSAAERSATPMFPESLPLTSRLEAAFIRRADSLPEDTRAVLLAAALAPSATTAEILAAADAMIGIPVDFSAVDAAKDERLVEVDGQHFRFRHPLVRSGVIETASPSTLRVAHLALASALADRERRLRHRARATVGFDEELAAELDRVAETAVRSGSLTSAVGALAQAAELTSPGPIRGGRLVRAADLSFELGQADATRHYLAMVEGNKLGRADHALARMLTMALDSRDTGDVGRVWELIHLAEEATAATDNDGALRLLEFASSLVNGEDHYLDAARAVASAAKAVPVSLADPRVIALLAFATTADGHPDLAGRLALVNDNGLTDPEAQRQVAQAAMMTGDYERSARLLSRAEPQLRKEARISRLTVVLMFRGFDAFVCGEWDLARQLLDEAERLAIETNQAIVLSQARYARAGIAGVCGDEEGHLRIVDQLAAQYREMHTSHRANHLEFMRGAAATMLGRADDAIALLSPLFDPAEPIFEVRTCSDALFYLADAAMAKNRADVVQRAIAALERTVPIPWYPVLRSAVDYARAVAAPEEIAGGSYEEALAGPAGVRVFDRARLQLAYGRWLRRQRRRVEACEQLRAARNEFDRLGNEPFGLWARDELRAGGEVSPRRTDAEWGQLTPQEAQIARLVAQGLSNKEIGEQLFLSHRTVASHLYRVYPKLGITSRGQLAAMRNSD